ncbi:MAG: flagellar hook capping FlgD N-terminal domain-containing protein [Marinibacterium sp.]
MSDLATSAAFSLANVPTPAGSATSATPGSAALSSDFETFLKLLTAQARFQDPLEPMDGSEYAAQLAQFSQVEQQVLTNENLEILQGQVATSNMQLLSGLIGLEALSFAPAYFDGAPVTVHPNPAAAADEVFLVVRDEAGTQVDRVSLPVSADPIQWDGLGGALPVGRYSFSIESWSDGELVLDEPAATYSEIREAQSLTGQTVVVLKGGTAIGTEAISGLRAPQGG